MKFASAKDGKVVIENMETPQLNAGDILVKMRACGVCGSDLEKVYGSYGMASKKIGHEIAGEVAESKSDSFIKGDRVFVHHHVPCYDCYYCKHDDYVLCTEYQKSNVEPCGLAEYIRVPAWNVSKGGVIRIADAITYEEAALAEPLACCIKAVNKLGKTETAAVIGAGPAGLMNALLLKEHAEVFLVDTNDFRLDFAQKYDLIGINAKDDVAAIIKDSTEGRGVDAVIVATGNVKALELSLQVVRKGGKIMIFGVPSKGSLLDFDANYLFSNEIQLLTSGYCSELETKAALRIIENKTVDVESLITHRFPLDKAPEAFDIAHRGEGMKVVVTG
ncbi:MAG: alcohol dehydrogenase catalytic domain-containing protein [Candidatus Aenigmarchaeota archaeon]|nr:alcohol dehydrogenase catalytic domain-containing protein [Candidatus Aenigmarchaeota archaeon]